MRILATGPFGPSEELGPLRVAGHEVVIGWPVDEILAVRRGEVPGLVVNAEAAPLWRKRR
jgi:hypothetical protein